MKAAFGVSVVVPVYNAENVLRGTVERLVEYLSSTFAHYELIIIDDGSVDQSPQILLEMAARNSQIRPLIHASNQGQQQTIAEGFLLSQHEIILSVDVDLPCSTHDLTRMAQCAFDGMEFVTGNRSGNPHRVWWRILGTKIVNKIVPILFGVEIHDFGCGVTAMRRSLIEKLRASKRPIRLIKLDILFMAENYLEIAISSPEPTASAKSSYSFWKLFRLFLLILAYRFQ
jgi:glycosyltransferase involved in cell wall biosynthesis